LNIFFIKNLLSIIYTIKFTIIVKINSEKSPSFSGQMIGINRKNKQEAAPHF